MKPAATCEVSCSSSSFLYLRLSARTSEPFTVRVLYFPAPTFTVQQLHVVSRATFPSIKRPLPACDQVLHCPLSTIMWSDAAMLELTVVSGLEATVSVWTWMERGGQVRPQGPGDGRRLPVMCYHKDRQKSSVFIIYFNSTTWRQSNWFKAAQLQKIPAFPGNMSLPLLITLWENIW